MSASINNLEYFIEFTRRLRPSKRRAAASIALSLFCVVAQAHLPSFATDDNTKAGSSAAPPSSGAPSSKPSTPGAAPAAHKTASAPGAQPSQLQQKTSNPGTANAHKTGTATGSPPSPLPQKTSSPGTANAHKTGTATGSPPSPLPQKTSSPGTANAQKTGSATGAQPSTPPQKTSKTGAPAGQKTGSVPGTKTSGSPPHKTSSTNSGAHHKSPNFVPATVTKAGKPIWLDLKSGQAASKAKKLLVIADFYTEWCSWCKVMEESTLKNPAVESYLAKNFICMRVNPEEGGAGEDLARTIGISGFPTYVIFNSKGEAIDQIVGFKEAPKFLQLLQEIVGANAKTSPSKSLKK